MDLINITWNKNTIDDFNVYLASLKNTEEKIARSVMIIKTQMEVLGIYAVDIKRIAKDIAKGNYKEFIKHVNFKYYETTLIFGLLLKYFDNFNEFSNQLEKLTLIMDNWATCDNLPFKEITKKFKEPLFEIAQKYYTSDLTFKRRVAILILFSYINVDNYNNQLLKIIDNFDSETEHYVNMILGWFLCELFIKDRALVVDYLVNSNLNKTATNIFIQKCRDSYRVTNEDKEFLLSFKK